MSENLTQTSSEDWPWGLKFEIFVYQICIDWSVSIIQLQCSFSGTCTFRSLLTCYVHKQFVLTSWLDNIQQCICRVSI